ncbi:MAG: chromate transporter [Aquabacterium sp.]
MTAADLGALALHFLMLSLLAVGGALTTAPDMHRWLVGEKGWLTDAAFSQSVALAQAAPGPNLLFVAVLGYNLYGLTGAAVTLGASLLPSATLALLAGRLGQRYRETLAVRAFTAGLAPLTVGLMLATGWILAQPALGDATARPGGVALVLGTTVLMLRTRLGPLWPIAVGAVVGVVGLA